MRLALGTAQFGLDYGVAGHGQIVAAEARRIVDLARKAGVDTIDTAIAYGNSEAVLGQIGVQDLKVITKLPGVPSDQADIGKWMEEQVRGSLDRLGIRRLHGLLLHRPDQLLTAHGSALRDGLLLMKSKGLVNRIGISVYSPEELDALWPVLDADIVQCPYSILDRRLEASGWLRRLNDNGVEVHARSVFLQGVLLLSADQRPGYFNRWSNVLDAFQAWTESVSMTAAEACLRFVNANDGISRVVVGVESADHLAEILTSISGRVAEAPPSLATEDLDLLLPTRWKD